MSVLAAAAKNVAKNEYSIKFHTGTSMEYSGSIQGTFREHSGNIQGTFRETS
jgi:hypothetical protein